MRRVRLMQQIFDREAPPRGPTPYPFMYHFSRKRYPFRIPSIDKWYPFHIPRLELCIPFNCCKCIVSSWIGRAAWEIWFNQSEALPKSGKWSVISGISALISQMSFRGETSGSVAKFRLFSQANHGYQIIVVLSCFSWDIELSSILLKENSVKPNIKADRSGFFIR